MAADEGDFEGELARRSQAGNEMVLNLIQSLGSAVVYADAGNVDTNRKLWDLYSAHWSPEEPWVRSMASNLAAEGAGEAAAAPPPPPELVGDEWSRPQDLDRVLAEFVEPFVVAGETRALEIGSGGGRVARRVAPLVGSLACCDISSGMLERARAALAPLGERVSFHLLPGAEPRLPAEFEGALDFVYSFDVFVHVDLHTQYQYFCEIRRALKPGGRAFVSTANLLAPKGWERFEAQRKFTVGGFYFVSPEIVNTLIARAGLVVLKTGAECQEAIDAGNMYFLRDYLVLVGLPAGV